MSYGQFEIWSVSGAVNVRVVSVMYGLSDVWKLVSARHGQCEVLSV